MDRLFLDANVLFSAAYREKAGVARLWALSSAALLTSEYAVEEARRNLAEPLQRDRLAALLRSLERAPSVALAPERRAGIALPDKDWPILGGALSGSATHLITGDLTHFGPWFGKRLLGVLVQSPADYLAAAGHSVGR